MAEECALARPGEEFHLTRIANSLEQRRLTSESRLLRQKLRTSLCPLYTVLLYARHAAAASFLMQGKNEFHKGVTTTRERERQLPWNALEVLWRASFFKGMFLRLPFDYDFIMVLGTLAYRSKHD